MEAAVTFAVAAAAVAERCSVKQGSSSGGSDTQQSNGPRQNAAACSWAAAAVEAAVAFAVAAAAVAELCSVRRGSGRGGSGTAELGAGEALGADDEADGDAEAPLDVDGVAEVLVLDVGVEVDDVDGFPVVEVAGDAGAWKSVQVSVRNVSPFAVTLNAVGVTVYFTPSLLMS